MMRRLILFAIVGLSLLTLQPAYSKISGVGDSDETTHLESPGTVAEGPVTLAAFNKRVDDSAEEYLKQYGPGAVGRIVLFDSAFPIDEEEFRASGGYGVLFISAFSRNQAELPLANVYINGIRLKFMGGKGREVPPGSRAYLAFGPYRVDSFWLVPANLFQPDAAISVDFARNRQGFSVGSGLSPPEFMRGRSASAPDGSPDVAILKKLVAREYPDFAIEISP